VIWDDQSEDPSISGVDKGIGYFYDSDDEDNNLTGGANARYFVGSGIPFNESDADQNNPTITGKDNWLFVGYDVSNPDVSNRFGLFYVMSTDNGQTWSPAFNVPNSNITPLTQYESDMPDLGLKPSLALTSTGSTYRIHAVWNHLSGGTFSKRYRVFFSYIDLNQRIDLYGTKPTWQTPESVTDSDENSINPVLFMTETGTPQGHIAYVEEEDVQNSTQDQYDVFYEGGVNGTIDPEYVIDEFDFDEDNAGDNGNGSPDGFKKVTPGVIETSSPSVSENLNYVLFFKNEGNLRAVGISVTDPIPANTTYNGDLATNISSKAVFNSGEVRWTGDVAPNTAVRITFSVKTNQAVPPTTVINTARMSSIGTGGAPFATSTAVTRIAGKFVFVPLVTK
jgi:uncharacterized repeat protein (TIGR01451 family)